MSIVHRLLCLIGTHRWMIQNDPETGARFLQCDHCGKERDAISLSDTPLGG